jgi:hypothetical protein
LAAVAAQYILPVPSLVQLGSELTAPAKLFHAPHFFPMNSLTMMTDLPLRTAHATCPVETGAQDGLPIPVALPVEMKPPKAPTPQAPSAGRQITIVDRLRFSSLCPRSGGLVYVGGYGWERKKNSQVYPLV